MQLRQGLDTCVLVFVIIVMMGLFGEARAVEPSFDCDRADGTIVELICQDEQLADLDRQLAEIYRAAARKAANEKPPVLKAEQRGWVKGRNETFWEHQGEATIVWGDEAPIMRCVRKP